MLHTNNVQAGQLKYHTKRKAFYRCVQYRVQSSKNHSGKAIIGVDRGLYTNPLRRNRFLIETM
ncbi:hypothetical protein PilKf_01313 [Pillotina sp. SPG140]|jgi:hypothetical protein